MCYTVRMSKTPFLYTEARHRDDTRVANNATSGPITAQHR